MSDISSDEENTLECASPQSALTIAMSLVSDGGVFSQIPLMKTVVSYDR